MTTTVTEKPATTTAAPKRTSRATKSAARNVKPASTTKKVTTKPATKKAPEPKGPSERQQRKEVIALVVAAGAKLVSEWNPARHHGIPRETALAAVKQALGYVPDTAWSYDEPHPVLGIRDVGRPAPVAKSK